MQMRRDERASDVLVRSVPRFLLRPAARAGRVGGRCHPVSRSSSSGGTLSSRVFQRDDGRAPMFNFEVLLRAAVR